jgi:ABC-2 type transport system permease protein
MIDSISGAGSLARLILRLDRIRLSVWVLVLSVVPIATASAFQSLYPGELEREQLASTVSANPAFTALLGPLYDTSVGGLTAWRIGTLGSFIAALMAVLTMIRHTRDDEETGRRELLGSTVVGRHAPLAASLLVTGGAGVLIGLIVAAGLIGLGLPAPGSIAFGLAMTGAILSFTAVGALAAQLTQAGSTARGLGVAITGVFFAIRMAGDAGAANGIGWLTWLSPIGWFSKLLPFGGERWWVVVLWIGFATLVTAVAVRISARRDVGEGAIPPRPGPARAPASLRAPAGLAWRLQRGSLLGWTAGVGALAVIYGAAADSIGDLIAENPQLARIFEQMGGEQTLTDAFFSAALGIIALIASAYSIRSVLKLKSEEDTLRSEIVLATATPRARYAWSHLFYGLVGPVVILAVAGALAGVTYGSIIGDVGGQVPRVVGAAMAQVPAVWVLAGATIALYGLSPRISSAAWGVLVGCLLLGQLGQILEFPQWLLDFSPFSHIPMIPAEDFVLTPFLILTMVTIVLVASGLTGFRRRDIPSV